MALGGPLLTGGCVVPLTVGCGVLSGTKLLKDIKTFQFQNNITIYERIKNLTVKWKVRSNAVSAEETKYMLNQQWETKRK